MLRNDPSEKARNLTDKREKNQRYRSYAQAPPGHHHPSAPLAVTLIFFDRSTERNDQDQNKEHHRARPVTTSRSNQTEQSGNEPRRARWHRSQRAPGQRERAAARARSSNAQEQQRQEREQRQQEAGTRAADQGRTCDARS